jgi:hypothetical protein
MADGASGDGAEKGVVMSVMACDATDDRALDATLRIGLRSCERQCENQRGRG